MAQPLFINKHLARLRTKNVDREAEWSGSVDPTPKVFLYALLVTVFSGVCKIQALFPLLATIHFQKVLLAVSIIGVLIYPNLRANIKKALNSKLVKVLSFWVIWMIVSIPFSVHPGGSYIFVTQYLWKLLISYLLLVAYGSYIKNIALIISAFILGNCVFGVAAFTSMAPGRFSLVEAYDANETAIIITSCIPFIFWRLTQAKDWLRKSILIGLIVVMMFTIISTGSRGGFLGLFAATGMCLIQYKKSVIKGTIILLVLALISLVILNEMRADKLDRILTITNGATDYNVTDVRGRISLWKRAVTIMMNNPVFGVGINQFITAEGRSLYGGGGTWLTVHNIFLQVGAELGLPGLFAFCYVLFGMIRKFRDIVLSFYYLGEEYRTYWATAQAFIGAWVGFVVAGSFLSAAYSNLVFLLLGISCAFINIASERLELVRLAQGNEE